MELIGEMVDNAGKAYPRQDAVIFGDSSFSYEELNASIDRMANGLKRLGISRGDPVMVQVQNSPEFIISLYGIIHRHKHTNKLDNVICSGSGRYFSSVKWECQKKERRK